MSQALHGKDGERTGNAGRRIPLHLGLVYFTVSDAGGGFRQGDQITGCTFSRGGTSRLVPFHIKSIHDSGHGRDMTRTGMASVDEKVLVRIILPQVVLQSRRSELLLVGVVVRRTGEKD